MQVLKIAVVVMGLAIVGGTVTLAVLLAQRARGPRPVAAPVQLGEPEGTRISGIAGTQDGVAVWLSGGGRPDRVVVVDPRRGLRLSEIRIEAAAP